MFSINHLDMLQSYPIDTKVLAAIEVVVFAILEGKRYEGYKKTGEVSPASSPVTASSSFQQYCNDSSPATSPLKGGLATPPVCTCLHSK